MQKNSGQFWSAYLAMKIKIKEGMGDQRIFGSKSVGVWQINFSNSARCAKNRLFCLIARAEGKRDAGSSDEKHSKLNVESNGIMFT
jgi:hypothetical protein